MRFSPHLLNSCDSIFGLQKSSACHPLVTHADGSLVSNSSPAKVGETITLYAVGFSRFGSSTVYTEPVSLPLNEYSVVSFKFEYPLLSETASAALPITTSSVVTTTQVVPEWVGPVPGYVGLFQINVTVPALPGPPRACTEYGNASLTLPPLSAGTHSICIQP